MNILLLRGKVPEDRDPSEIQFRKISECDDIWTQLVYNVINQTNGTGEVWYYGGKRYHKYNKYFVEQYKPTFDIPIGKQPDVILARGGFNDYNPILKKCKKSFKIYYGAGKRFHPLKSFTNYQLILVDSIEQYRECKSLFPKIPCSFMLKPAPDNIMYPYNVKKDFDICFPANGSQSHIKGHKFVYTNCPGNFKVLNLGNKSRYRKPENTTSQRVLRKDIARYYSRCKLGIVCCTGLVDSCPRVLPEMLACNIPVVVKKGLYFWEDKYINQKTGIVADANSFWEAVRYVLMNLDTFEPRKYYLEHLSMECAVNNFIDVINKTLSGEIK